MERVEGTTPAITAHALFDFYETVYYYTPVISFPFERKTLGKWLGVAYNATDELAYVILTPLGTVIIRKSAWAIPTEDKKTDAFMADLLELDSTIDARIGDHTLTKSNIQQGNLCFRKRDRIIKKVKSRYWTRSHKYGPHSVEEALAIDKRTGTTFWREAIEKEMKNVLMAFESIPKMGNHPLDTRRSSVT
jgi:hypothetical protein